MMAQFFSGGIEPARSAGLNRGSRLEGADAHPVEGPVDEDHGNREENDRQPVGQGGRQRERARADARRFFPRGRRRL